MSNKQLSVEYLNADHVMRIAIYIGSQNNIKDEK